jgi:hypothetical protein
VSKNNLQSKTGGGFNRPLPFEGNGMVEESKKTGEPKEEAPKTAGTIYWAPAADYQLANWKVKTDKDGNITHEVAPLRFAENIYIAKTQEECDFIEGKLPRCTHNAFSNGQIIKCRNLAHARELSALRMQKKRVTRFDTETSCVKTFNSRGQEIASTG